MMILRDITVENCCCKKIRFPSPRNTKTLHQETERDINLPPKSGRTKREKGEEKHHYHRDEDNDDTLELLPIVCPPASCGLSGRRWRRRWWRNGNKILKLSSEWKRNQEITQKIRTPGTHPIPDVVCFGAIYYALAVGARAFLFFFCSAASLPQLFIHFNGHTLDSTARFCIVHRRKGTAA